MRKIHSDFALGTIGVLGLLLIPTVSHIPAIYAQHQPTMTHLSTIGQGQTILINLHHGTNDIHAAFMALKLGSNMQKRGAQVTLVLILEGVRIADNNQPLNLRWGSSSMTLGELYNDFIAAGGKVMVCPVCAEAVGLNASNLRAGANFALGDQDIPNLILMADKVMDF
jgi:predicted peroxiredoxin